MSGYRGHFENSLADNAASCHHHPHLDLVFYLPNLKSEFYGSLLAVVYYCSRCSLIYPHSGYYWGPSHEQKSTVEDLVLTRHHCCSELLRRFMLEELDPLALGNWA
jgi:hypothetical protein